MRLNTISFRFHNCAVVQLLLLQRTRCSPQRFMRLQMNAKLSTVRGSRATTSEQNSLVPTSNVATLQRWRAQVADSTCRVRFTAGADHSFHSLPQLLLNFLTMIYCNNLDVEFVARSYGVCTTCACTCSSIPTNSHIGVPSVMLLSIERTRSNDICSLTIPLNDSR